MTSTPEFITAHRDPERNERALALQQAHALAGDPDVYEHASTRTAEGTATPASGVMGVFGATKPAGKEHTEYEHNSYPDVLIQLADYIKTGRRDREDEVQDPTEDVNDLDAEGGQS